MLRISSWRKKRLFAPDSRAFFPSALHVLVLLLLASGCGFQKQADAKFGDQHFKTAIALIELHKVRFGDYPESLAALRFTGQWDAIALNGVQYKRTEAGYELNVVRGWIARPTLSYPREFWQGLGLTKSNVKSSS